jgi:hypothetical protein
VKYFSEINPEPAVFFLKKFREKNLKKFTGSRKKFEGEFRTGSQRLTKESVVSGLLA